MNSRASRLILSPIRQWRASRLMAAHGKSLSYSTAWCLVTLARDPGELPYVRNYIGQVRLSADRPDPVGVFTDVWEQVDAAERVRRMQWLDRYAATPLYRLGVTVELMELAGMYVVEWALPPDVEARSIIDQV